MEINLISDTVTRPSEGMLQAMLAAQVGDDVFKEDQAVNQLEETVAALFGMEKALFFPSGTMANQTAIKLHTQPGDQLICDHYAHVYNYEGGGVSFNSGVSCKLIVGDRGRINASQVLESINPPDFYHSPKTRLVCLENTTNKGGGACYDFEEIKKIKEVCHAHDLRLHLDGARLWNALEATNDDPVAYGQVFDTISVCFSKGLGCPVGSMLIGSEKAMESALRIRKVLGGGMRQAGYLAAAASYALEHHRKPLVEDHKKAKEIEHVLQGLEFVAKVEPVSTNIVIFSLKEGLDDNQFITNLATHGVRLIQLGKGKIRIVTHRDYTLEHHNHFIRILKSISF